MGRKIFYGELGEIERICYREGCYWKINGKCGNNRHLERLGKECLKEEERECEEWREDRKWKEEKR